MNRTAMFSGFHNRFWKGKTALEIFRFVMYVTVPVMTSVIYANPERMHDLIMHLKLVEYPEAVPISRIPVGDEVERFRAASVLSKAKKASE